MGFSKNSSILRGALTAFIYICLINACSKFQSNGIESPHPTKPNILIILADDLGYYDMSNTGSRFYETPNLDALAKESIQFTRAYASSPVCSPSRAGILTGQSPTRHGITDWIGALTGEQWRKQGRYTKMLPADNKESLSTHQFTLSEAMKQAGYTTFISGKWHLGGEGSSPANHGFDVNKGAWEKGSPVGGYYDPYENPVLANRKPGEALPFRLADETASFIEDHKNSSPNKPFFAFLSFYAVHSPLQTTEEKWKKYRDKADSLGIAESGFEMGKYLPIRTVQDNPIYAGLVETMDEAVGHILNRLKELNLDENTIIIFTSDHGGVSSGDHYSTTNLPLRAGKGSLFEGGIRVPFFMKVPEVTKAGSISNEPIINTDIYPTLLELTGQSLIPEQHSDGVSLVPLLRGENIEIRELIWHYPHYSNQDSRPSSAIRKGKWKLIYDYETEAKELYNLNSDLSESTNLILQFPQKADSLFDSLMIYLVETNALFPKLDPEYNALKEKNRLNNMRLSRMVSLEEQRKNFLSPNFNPDNNWWGSQQN